MKLLCQTANRITTPIGSHKVTQGMIGQENNPLTRGHSTNIQN